MARIARGVLSEVHVVDLDADGLRALAETERFDCVIFADILEHLVDPWRILRQGADLLRPGGQVVISLPNIRHISSLASVLFTKEWPYRDRGIHDRTHLRFFAFKNVQALAASAGLSIKVLHRNLRFFDSPHRVGFLTRALAKFGFSDLLTYQYVLRASRILDQGPSRT